MACGQCMLGGCIKHSASCVSAANRPPALPPCLALPACSATLVVGLEFALEATEIDSTAAIKVSRPSLPSHGQQLLAASACMLLPARMPPQSSPRSPTLCLACCCSTARGYAVTMPAPALPLPLPSPPHPGWLRVFWRGCAAAEPADPGAGVPAGAAGAAERPAEHRC